MTKKNKLQQEATKLGMKKTLESLIEMLDSPEEYIKELRINLESTLTQYNDRDVKYDLPKKISSFLKKNKKPLNRDEICEVFEEYDSYDVMTAVLKLVDNGELKVTKDWKILK